MNSGKGNTYKTCIFVEYQVQRQKIKEKVRKQTLIKEKAQTNSSLIYYETKFLSEGEECKYSTVKSKKKLKSALIFNRSVFKFVYLKGNASSIPCTDQESLN